MSAEVVSLAAARRARGLPPRDRMQAQAEVRGSLVVLLARDRDVAFTPAAARSLANRLLALADFAQGIPSAQMGDAEVRARLALLGQAVARVDSGEARGADLMALVRQLTAEVRGG